MLNSENINDISEDIDIDTEHNQNSLIYEKTYQLIESLVSLNIKDKVNIIKKIILNICQNPQETKYHELKMNNKIINELFSVDSIKTFFEYIHFNKVEYENKEISFILLHADLHLLNSVYNYLCLLDSDDSNEIFNFSQKEDNEVKEKEKENKLNVLEFLKSTSTNRQKAFHNDKDIKQVLKDTAYIRSNKYIRFK